MSEKKTQVFYQSNTTPLDTQKYCLYLLERLAKGELKEFKAVRTKDDVLFIEGTAVKLPIK